MKNTILFLLPLLAACSKGGRADSGTPLAGAWLQTAERANGQNLWCDYYYDPCRFDDRWIFYPDGAYEVADSGLRCGPGLGGARRGNWRLEGATLWLDGSAWFLLRGSNDFSVRQERTVNGFTVSYEMGFTPAIVVNRQSSIVNRESSMKAPHYEKRLPEGNRSSVRAARLPDCRLTLRGPSSLAFSPPLPA